MPFVPSRDGFCFSFIGNVNVCPFSLSLVPLAVLASFFSLSPPFRIFSFWFSIPWFSYISRGRRQLPQAGEVRRPPGRGVRLWLVCYVLLLLWSAMTK